MAKHKLNGRDKKRVIEALVKSDGFIGRAAKLLAVHPQTLAKYLEETPEVNDHYRDKILFERNEGYDRTYHKLAMGEVAYEKTIKNDEGEFTVVYYKQKPHYPALANMCHKTGFIKKSVLDSLAEDLGSFLTGLPKGE